MVIPATVITGCAVLLVVGSDSLGLNVGEVRWEGDEVGVCDVGESDCVVRGGPVGVMLRVVPGALPELVVLPELAVGVFDVVCELGAPESGAAHPAAAVAASSAAINAARARMVMTPPAMEGIPRMPVTARRHIRPWSCPIRAEGRCGGADPEANGTPSTTTAPTEGHRIAASRRRAVDRRTAQPVDAPSVAGIGRSVRG
jgi:hypothetical protein